MSDAAPATEAPASTAVTLADLVADIVASYVTHNAVPPSDMPALISAVHGTLSGLGRPPEAAPEPARPTPPVPIRRSVTDAHLISLEDGKPYRSLKRHLTKRGLMPADYRAKWGLPADYPMVAPGYARARSQLAKAMGLGNLRRKR